MTHRHPKESPETPDKPFPSEEEMAQDEASILRDQRADRGHGGVSYQRDDADNPVKNSQPFKNLS